MSKVQLVVRDRSERGHARFTARVEELLPDLLAREPRGLKVTAPESAPPRLSLVPFARVPAALLSIWTDGELGEWARIAERRGFEVSAHAVEESTPLAYRRTWADGERTPSVVLLTLFRRRPGLNDGDFIRRWHGGHTPLALSIHPYLAYQRNVVVASHGSPLDAIVEEHFPSREALLHPHRLFGGPLRMWPNMARVALDIARFIDLRSLENHLLTERWIRTPR
jgi:hypothetical protein